MRSYYRLIILNLAVMAPLTSPALLRESRINPKFYLLICFTLPLVNYMLTREIARQRGTSTFSFEIALWASWVFGPSVTAMFILDVVFHTIKRDLGGVNIALGQTAVVGSAWIVVRKAEREGWWRKIDPKGPKTLSDALRG